MAALPLLAAAPAWAQSAGEPQAAAPRPGRGASGRAPSRVDQERDRIEEYHRRRREYLAVVARMA